MDLGGLLSKYLNVPGEAHPDTEDHFDQVAQHAPTQTVSQGISDALRSDQTPSLGDMVSQAFSQADPQQHAGMLNEILSSLGPNVLSSLGGAAGGGALGGILGQLTRGGTPQVTPQQASQVPPSAVQDHPNLRSIFANPPYEPAQHLRKPSLRPADLVEFALDGDVLELR